jgi:hypothetical protein
LEELGARDSVKSVGPILLKQNPQIGPKLKEAAANVTKKNR